MRILIIEDQQKLADNLRRTLEHEGYIATCEHDGRAGLDRALTEPFDLLVLDLNLPSLDGIQVCKQLRKAGQSLPILMLTARSGADHAVRGLDAGADDYLAKPFALDELLARVRALSRRQAETADAIDLGAIRIDVRAQRVERDGQVVHLSPREYGLLHYLASHRGEAQDRATLLERVWGGRDDLLFSQTVDVHVAYLRRKLGKEVIETVPGVGYLVA